jgi:hypothetical protein
MVLPAPARVPARLLTALVAEKGLGDLHLALATMATWTHDRGPLRRELDQLVTELGWRDRRGQLEREVAATLAVLCRPAVEFYGWITHQDNTIGVLAASIAREGVLAIRDADGTVRLSNVHSRRLAEHLVAQTPPVPPGATRPFTVSIAEVRATDRTGRQRTATGANIRRADPEVRLAKTFATTPATGAGHLYVAVRDADGIRRDHEHTPVSYLDNVRGRYAERLTGAGMVTVRPATRDDLVTELRTRQRQLAGP